MHSPAHVCASHTQVQHLTKTLNTRTQQLAQINDKLDQQVSSNHELRTAHKKLNSKLRRERQTNKILKVAKIRLSEELEQQRTLSRKLESKVLLAADKLSTHSRVVSLQGEVEQLELAKLALQDQVSRQQHELNHTSKELQICRAALQERSGEVGMSEQRIYSMESAQQSSMEFALLAAEWKRHSSEAYEQLQDSKGEICMLKREVETRRRDSAELSHKCAVLQSELDQTSELLHQHHTSQAQESAWELQEKCADLHLQVPVSPPCKS
eukprot:TRINITY_DN16677_c0_g1_i2.p1 TRINITY_DN16677_c0_g1~~TRINITY_DN16677_c0_g1_i2.p1  ORF type:complete len:268 (-),score=76.90 TRINITY_DN16677_c0_g1_i2:583-1386(-)